MSYNITVIISVPSSYPVDVHCSPLGSQTLQMSWKYPEMQYWNGVIQGFVVTYDSIDRGIFAFHIFQIPHKYLIQNNMYLLIIT